MLIYALPLLAALRDPVKQVAKAAEVKVTAAKEGVVRGLLTNRNFLLLVAYFTLPAIAGWVVRDWMPEILREKFNLGQGKAGVSAILYVQLASIVGVLVGGALADRWMKRTNRGRIFTSAIGMVLFLPALFGVGHAQTLAMAIFGLIIFGLGWGVLRLQQHADSNADRPARVACDRLWNHESCQHQLRWIGRLGLRDVARPARAA
ncbi:MAG: MFS transporter [Magnetospirillum sp.]|nr:MFS transporter [Magnetospirillum sp.]